ncbi:hypothetical protein [Bacillus phage YungSlug]|nr:hypothetical protein [Bacillus phage YungSlug]
MEKKYALTSQGVGQGIHLLDPYQEFDLVIFHGSFQDFKKRELEELKKSEFLKVKQVISYWDNSFKIICDDTREFARDYIYTAKMLDKATLVSLMR